MSCACIPSATPQPAPCSAEPAPTPLWPPGRSAAHAACVGCPWARRRRCRHLVPASDVAVGPWSFCNTVQGEKGSGPSADDGRRGMKPSHRVKKVPHREKPGAGEGGCLWEPSSTAVHEEKADYSTILGRPCGLKNQRTNRPAWEDAS